jgi:hypothetical protein
MTLFSALLHLIELILPALFISAALVTAGPWVLRLKRQRTRAVWLKHWLVNAALGVVLIVAGLWLYGVDGKIMTYAGLVTVNALAVFIQLSAWRE